MSHIYIVNEKLPSFFLSFFSRTRFKKQITQDSASVTHKKANKSVRFRT